MERRGDGEEVDGEEGRWRGREIEREGMERRGIEREGMERK